jgi:hypothetical protein
MLIDHKLIVKVGQADHDLIEVVRFAGKVQPSVGNCVSHALEKSSHVFTVTELADLKRGEKWKIGQERSHLREVWRVGKWYRGVGLKERILFLNRKNK